MSRIISASIDLDKIDISKVKAGKNGGKYVNISIIINDSVDQYGNDTSITIGQTKEEREAKERKTFIGNGKTVYNQ